MGSDPFGPTSTDHISVYRKLDNVHRRQAAARQKAPGPNRTHAMKAATTR